MLDRKYGDKPWVSVYVVPEKERAHPNYVWGVSIEKKGFSSARGFDTLDKALAFINEELG